MIEIERSQERIDQNGEVFTPPELVNEMLDQIPKETWKDPDKKWLEPACGDGNFLIAIKERLLKYHTEDHILNNMLYGVDLMEDNVMRTIERLYGEGEIQEYTTEDDEVRFFTHNGSLVKHIVQADGLTYDYNFDPPGTWGNGLFTN